MKGELKIIKHSYIWEPENEFDLIMVVYHGKDNIVDDRLLLDVTFHAHSPENDEMMDTRRGNEIHVSKHRQQLVLYINKETQQRK